MMNMVIPSNAEYERSKQQSTTNKTKDSIRLNRSPMRAYFSTIFFSILFFIPIVLLLWFLFSDDFTTSGLLVLLCLVLIFSGWSFFMMKSHTLPYLEPGHIEISSTHIRQFEQDELITMFPLDPFVNIIFQRQHGNIIDGYIFKRGEEDIEISIYIGYQRTDIERILPFILKLINKKEITWEGKSVESTYKITDN